MLVLTRREGESIYIGDDIEIKIVSFRGNQVSVGIQAPAEVKILRSELTENNKGIDKR